MRPLIPSQLLESRVVAILRHSDLARTIHVVAALESCGICCVEVTLNTSDAFETIRAVRERFGASVVVGAGTVLDPEGAIRALEYGADFIVTPNTDERVISAVVDRGVACIPGAMTPSEIVRAWTAWASAVKVFPATTLGPDYVRAVRGPLDDVPLIAVGGIHASNAAAFISAGCAAVGVGSWLVGDHREAIDSRSVEDRAKQLLSNLRDP